MRDSKGDPTRLFKALWHCREASEKEVILYFVYSPPPVSVDALISLSGASAVAVLEVMERLRKAKLACEKKGHRKGVYFPPDNVSLASVVQDYVPADEARRAARKVLEYYDGYSHLTEEQTLMLADLYRTFGKNGEGSRHIKAAAAIVQRSGQKEKALEYYDCLLQMFTNEEPTEVRAGDFLDGAIGKTSIMIRRAPVKEQIALLTKAEKIAMNHKKFSYLPMIKLYLGRLFQDSGDTRSASRCIEQALKLLQKNGDPAILRSASLLVSEYLIWKGSFAEATLRYEEMVGDVERFGEDQAVLLASGMVGGAHFLCVGGAHFLCGRIARGLGLIDAVRAKARSLEFEDVVRSCDAVTAFCLIELQKIPEAETYIDKVLSAPEEVLGPHLLWLATNCKAYIRCLNEDYEGAFESVRLGHEFSRVIGPTFYVGLWPFDVLSILESKGFTSETFNFDAELDKVLRSDNIYLKGMALRHRALRTTKRGGSVKAVAADLLASESYLERSGAQAQLARTRIALSYHYQVQGDEKAAQSYLTKASAFLSMIDRDLVPRDLLEYAPQEEKVGFMLEKLTKINQSLGTMRDVSSFLDRVLSVAMDFALAKRAAFIEADESDDLRFIASRNLDPSVFKHEDAQEVKAALLHAMRNGVEVVEMVRERQEVHSSSYSVESVRLIICMPARLDSTTFGYLCLDNRLNNRPFSAEELPFLRMLCSQIAVGLADIRLHEKLKEQLDRFENENIYYKREMGVADGAPEIVGESEAMKTVLSQARHVAMTGSSVLIFGETGVGKELVAKAVHNQGTHAKGPFISVNLATLPPDLVASELFGHEKGAFTGAHQQSKGRFELADGGTIFLDEIGDTPLDVQVKLLRVLQEGTFERLGSAKPIRSNFTVVAATNKDLRVEVAQKTFREDLYYRLNVFPIYIPPLRERRDDIPLLTRHFIAKFNKKLGKQIRRVHPQEMRKLIDYDWPGNVRELEHVIERAVVLSDGKSIGFPDLNSTLDKEASGRRRMVALHDIERDHIVKILHETEWRESGPGGAAALLELNVSTLRFRMKRLGIKKPASAAYSRK
jgi:transcriptional regulator with GAF, ATPase, and Fis domain/tetratricopeptide (TPR) repeat protein